MNTKRIFGVTLLAVVLAGLVLNQWRLHRALKQLGAERNVTREQQAAADEAAAKLRQAEARLDEAQAQLAIAEQKLTATTTRLTRPAADARLDLGIRRQRPAVTTDFILRDSIEAEGGLEKPNSTTKRSWGPEQATGEPDTFLAGDVSTAWAPLEPDGGEEWLRLEYDKVVDISEVRVRETYNPGAIAKVTALLANGNEVTLWEGDEPKSDAPIEMAFKVAFSVSAKTVKVYLDTKRVPGWNEIDAVQLVGRDGSLQWASSATASSTYAQPRLTESTRRLNSYR